MNVAVHADHHTPRRSNKDGVDTPSTQGSVTPNSPGSDQTSRMPIPNSVTYGSVRLRSDLEITAEHFTASERRRSAPWGPRTCALGHLPFSEIDCERSLTGGLFMSSKGGAHAASLPKWNVPPAVARLTRRCLPDPSSTSTTSRSVQSQGGYSANLGPRRGSGPT